MSKYIPLILLVVTTNALSQLLLKQGMNKVGGIQLGGSALMQALPAVAFNPWVVAGLSTLVLSTCLHLMVLSRVELSYAYPFLSIAYVLVLFSSYFLFAESVNTVRILGVGLICIGTFFVARS